MTLPTLEQVKAAIAADEKNNNRKELRAMLEQLTRIELLDFEDIYGPKEIGFVWNTFYEVMYEHDWPLKGSQFEDFAADDSLKLEKLSEQVNGIQKKIDKIVHLLDGFEIKMSVKDALKL